MISLRSLRLCGRKFLWQPPFLSHPNRSIFLLTIIICFSSPQIALAASADSAIQEGIVDYQQKEYANAESNFSKAAQERPDNPNLNYNLGNSQYKTGKFKEALQTYTKAMVGESPPELKEKALYNTGNTLFRLGKLEEAATAYKKALEVDPNDMDAKFNLEFVREQIKKKKEEEKQKQNQPQGSNSKDNPNQQPNDTPGNKEDDQGNPSDPQEQDASGEPEKEKSSSAEQQETAQTQDGAISKDQADQWLGALDENLKKFRQKQAGKETAGRPQQSRDW